MVWLGSLGSTPRMSNFDPHWLLLLPFPVGVTFAIVLLFRRSSHARSGLERWASTKKYVILHFEKCFLRSFSVVDDIAKADGLLRDHSG